MYKKGKIFGNRNFTLRYVPNGKNANRLGIVVSKKVSKKAVVRNRLRRQIRELYKNNVSSIKQGYDMIITAKPLCAGEEYSVLEKSFRHVLSKQGLMPGSQRKR